MRGLRGSKGCLSHPHGGLRGLPHPQALGRDPAAELCSGKRTWKPTTPAPGRGGAVACRALRGRWGSFGGDGHPASAEAETRNRKPVASVLLLQGRGVPGLPGLVGVVGEGAHLWRRKLQGGANGPGGWGGWGDGSPGLRVQGVCRRSCTKALRPAFTHPSPASLHVCS